MMATLTELTGGALVVARLMRQRCNRALTSEQANSLWMQCETRLIAKDLAETVTECAESDCGSLDTLPRDDVLSVLAEELAGCDWPINGSPQEHMSSFVMGMCAAFKRREYTRGDGVAA